MIKAMAYFSDGTLEQNRDLLPSGEIPGSPSLAADLHELVRRSEQDHNAFVWIALFEPTHAEMKTVADLFELPALQADDASNPRQRAKVEIGDHHAFLIFKVLSYLEETSDIETGQMAIFVGGKFVVTVRHGVTGSMDWVLDRIAGTQELLDFGPVAVLHAVLDAAVDDYLTVIDEVSTDIEKIEVSVFSGARTDDSRAIYQLKRENLEIRRAVLPLVPAAQVLARNQASQMPRALRPYFQDIGDHLLRAADAVDSNDSLLITILMAATARLDLQQNRDMRKITAWVSMAAVPTLLAAIYGMNFDNMPELHWKFGYPLVLVVMLTICGLLYRGFKKSGWL